MWGFADHWNYYSFSVFFRFVVQQWLKLNYFIKMSKIDIKTCLALSNHFVRMKNREKFSSLSFKRETSEEMRERLSSIYSSDIILIKWLIGKFFVQPHWLFSIRAESICWWGQCDMVRTNERDPLANCCCQDQLSKLTDWSVNTELKVNRSESWLFHRCCAWLSPSVVP